jgi:hypothetical protein
MILLNIIQLFIDKKIDKISKFELFKLFKQFYQHDFTYYKSNLLLEKLIETRILIKENNYFVFNKEKNKKENKCIVYFD